MAENLSLFAKEPAGKKPARDVPLAERLRPASFAEFEGLDAIDSHLLASFQGGSGIPPSIILWGPPGCGKTTLARLLSRASELEVVELSAVLSGVKDIRDVVADAERKSRPTLLFIDEIHRFNKAQQDAFLPHIEAGRIVLIGATTENPSFVLTAALRSRCRIVVLPPLSAAALRNVATRCGEALGLAIDAEGVQLLIETSGGDARQLIRTLETIHRIHPEWGAGVVLSRKQIEEVLGDKTFLRYDRAGEEHYNLASAFIKSLRGSDPDAALYWGFRMLDGGEDPRFIIRRMVIFASEDIGNADPRALALAVATSAAFEQVGLPEGRIPIAQCMTYLACAPKSNRSYAAMQKVAAAIQRDPYAPVPLHLRNAPTALMKELGYGREYVYPHEEEGAYAEGVTYLPASLEHELFYEPSERGAEKNHS